MKRIIFALLFLPQLAYSQYRADCFRLDISDNVSQIRIGNTFSRDTTLNISDRTTISGLSISGTTVLNNDNDSYVRVTLVDKYNYEFLVYENYPTLSDDLTTTFTNIALETIFLDDITPQCLKISMLNATLELDTISFSNASSDNRRGSNNPSAIQKAQTQYIVNKLNANLERRNMTWRAGITSISEKTYSEKKDMFGGTVPELYGFEHYVGGVFVVPREHLNSLQKSTSSSQYVSEWDWRNRHGKNWMTSVKNQGSCGSCGAFSALGALEAYINLYYNQTLNYDLSEEELISCVESFDCQTGMNQGTALTYAQNNGIVKESCFPYVGYEKDCNEKCNNPSERIFLEEHDTIYYTSGENYIKRRLFMAPLPFGINSWEHALVLVGYITIQAGDVIRTGPYTTVTINTTDHQNLIGKTAWLLKNSWHTSWGSQGYAYVYTDVTDLRWMYAIDGKITSLEYSDSDIVCEDADGDGYYFWGIGSKPSWIPSWVPNTPDGDDSNSSKGSMDQYGNLESLSTSNTLIISGNVIYTSSQALKCNIRIPSNTSLTIKSTLNLFGSVQIYIESNGQLIVDGGVVTNADISMSSGGKITLKNGGTIVVQTGKDFNVPTNALLDMTNGKILRSNDF
jgi:C1A family cysteine protease